MYDYIKVRTNAHFRINDMSMPNAVTPGKTASKKPPRSLFNLQSGIPNILALMDDLSLLPSCTDNHGFEMNDLYQVRFGFRHSRHPWVLTSLIGSHHLTAPEVMPRMSWRLKKR